MKPDSAEERFRLSAAVVSLAVGLVLLTVKFLAYRLTGSTAVLSDALESITNVVAAGFAIGGVLFAGRPADRGHPYGHGKIEFFTAAFEGGLIAFAAFLIFFHAVHSMVGGHEVQALDLGLLLILGSGGVNALLGLFLIRTGRTHDSLTLVADGKHVLSDSWTSLGVFVALILVRVTGQKWIDPLLAALIGVNLAWIGFKLVRQAAGGLLDEEDPEVVSALVDALEKTDHPGIIRIHHLRAIRFGRFHHVDAHLVVPDFWSVSQAHEESDAFAGQVMRTFGKEGEISFHTDPCRRAYCSCCRMTACPIRSQPFSKRPALTVEEAVQPDLPEDALPVVYREMV